MDKAVYHTVAHPVQHEIKVRGSRFIARLKNASDRDEAQAFLDEIRKADHAATHHCFAYRIGLSAEADTRFNDDGEPSGTAGKPILTAILGAELTNVIIVVTRYFGGTKLGTGGLARAYGEAARLAIEKAVIVTTTRKTQLTLRYGYPLSQMIERLFEKYHVIVEQAAYTVDIAQTVSVRQDWADEFKNDLVEASGNHIAIEDK